MSHEHHLGSRTLGEGSTSLKGPSKAELRRAAREARAAQWAAFNDTRPSPEALHPADAAAIAAAESSVGDYRLKSSPGYMAPEVIMAVCFGGARARGANFGCNSEQRTVSRQCSFSCTCATAACPPALQPPSCTHQSRTCAPPCIHLPRPACLQAERLTPARKRGQMLRLAGGLDAACSDFNAALEALRQRKRGLVVQLAALHERLRGVNQHLGISGAPGAVTDARMPR